MIIAIIYSSRKEEYDEVVSKDFLHFFRNCIDPGFNTHVYGKGDSTCTGFSTPMSNCAYNVRNWSCFFCSNSRRIRSRSLQLYVSSVLGEFSITKEVLEQPISEKIDQ